MTTPLPKMMKQVLNNHRNILFIFLFSLSSILNSAFAQTQTYSSGSGSFQVPAGVTSVVVEVWGGGGGGGRASGTNGAAGGGGGGGAYAKKTFTGLTGGSSLIYYNVGTAGTGSTSSAASSAGGNTWANITNTAPSTNAGALASGGAAGASITTNAAGNGGAGGSTGFGDLVRAGGAGANGVSGTTASSGGGGGGASGNVSAAGAAATGRTGGVGLNPAPNFGSGGNGAANTAGTAGGNYGGGGAGGHRNGNSNNGGNGASGYVLITYCASPVLTASNLAGQTVCLNSTFTSISVTATGAGLTYQWFSNSTASNTAGSNLGTSNGAQTNSYTPQATAAGTTYYYCVVTSSCGGTVTSNVSGAFVVSAPSTNTMSYPTNNYCSSTSGIISVASQTATAGGIYTATPAGLNINSTNGAVTLNGSAVNNYIVKYTVAGGVCPIADSTNFNIRPLPSVSCPGNSATCLNTPAFQLTGASPLGGTFSASSGVTGSSGIYYFNPSVAGSGIKTINYSITDLNGCSNSCNFTINVTGAAFTTNANPVASFVYSGDSVKILLSSTVSGTQYTWTASTNNPNVTGWSSQSTPTSVSSITQQVFNSSTNIGQITYTITPSLNGCSGTPMTIVISLPSSTFCESPGTFQRGSCIIDMGVVPQTYNNGLKPYGLVYQLLNVNKVPVYWAIKPDKSFGANPLNKVDTTDFILDGINYKGGAFIIPAAYLSQVQTVINSWVSQGVVVRYASTSFNPPVYELLTRIPNAVLDVRSGATIQNGFYERAGIPLNAYTLGGVPTNIANCDDIYVLPHAEPELWTQPYKDSLLNFINNRGWLYSSCRAVSAIESNVGMNFLSSTGLILDSQHGDGTPPYAYSSQSGLEAVRVASDPLMQSIGKLDDAIDWGAETIFLPKTTWRPTTKIAIYDSNFVNNGITYPNNAAILAYGRAFGNPSKGLIVYLAGHDLNHGVEAANVAAARIYGNFLLRSGITARPVINPVSIPTSANSGETVQLSVTVPASTSSIVSSEWSSDLNGIFSSPTSQTTSFTLPAVDVQTICTVQFKVTDACGRVGLFCTTIIINPTITNNYIGVSQTICTGTAPNTLTGTLPVAPNGGSVTYQWLMSTTSASSGFGPASGTNNAQSYTSPALTQTTWFRRQVFANGISVFSTTVQVTVNQGPAIAAQPSVNGQTICTGGTLNALTVTTSESPVTYQWFTNSTASNVGGTAIAGTNNASYTPPTPLAGIYYFYCVLTNINGCSTTSNVTGAININNSLLITAQPSQTPQVACQGSTITPLLCNGNGAGLVYEWWYTATATPGQAGSSVTGGAIVPGGPYTSSFTPNLVGSYYYYCKVTAPSSACAPALRTSTVSGLITINASPSAGITNNSGATEINCARASISLTATGGVSYSWNNGLGNSASINITSPGNDTVTVTGANGCTARSGITITRNLSLPAAGITNNYATNALTCENTAISVTATGGGTYLWSNGLGTNASVYLTSAGTFTVTVTGANGCSKDTSIVIVSNITGSTWTGAGADLYWSNPDNWCGPVPTDTSDVIIPNTGGNDPVISNDDAHVRNLTIQPGANVYIDGETLEINGNLNASGNLDAIYGKIELKGTTPQTISGSSFAQNRVKDLRISNAAGVTLGGTNDTLKLTGTLDFGKSNCTLNANGNLTIVSDAGNTGRVGDMTSDGLYTGNKITGNVTVERYIPNHTKAWQMLAVPTVGQTIKQAWQEGNTPMANLKPGLGTIITSNNGGSAVGANALGFDIYTSTGPSLKYFNAADSTWVGVASTNTTPIANTKGYMILVRGDRSVTTSSMAPTATKMRTTGLLYQPIGNAPATINVMANKYESVGNPYASALDLTKLTRTGGVQDVYYVWDPKLTTAGSSAYGLGGYQTFIRNGSTYTVTPGGGSYAGGNANIESGQAFLVRSYGTAGTVSFAENQKIVGGYIVTRENNQISNLHTKLSVIYGGTPVLIDGALAQFDESFSNNINEDDAIKLAGSSTENISILRDGIKLAGDKRNIIISSDTMFYNLGNLKTQSYQLQIHPEEMSAVALSARLVDNYLGTSTPISFDSVTIVNFTSALNTPSAATNRFYVVFESLAALPVTIKTISASRNSDKTNTVYWSVENEINIVKYTVEASADGNSFHEMGMLSPKSNNGGSSGYSLVDLRPFAGKNFYRVKAVSVNGMIQYSRIVTVLAENSSNTVRLYPNPVVNHTANVYFNEMPIGAYRILIYNSAGQLLQNSNIVTTFKTEKISLPLNAAVIPGSYDMQIVSLDGKNYKQHFIVE